MVTHQVKVAWLCDRWESNVIGSGGVREGVWWCCTIHQLAREGVERWRD
jgi:hypothetical protein